MITEATPITTPISVRMERSLLPHSDCSASLKASISFMVSLFPQFGGPTRRRMVSIAQPEKPRRCGFHGRLSILTDQDPFGTQFRHFHAVRRKSNPFSEYAAQASPEVPTLRATLRPPGRLQQFLVKTLKTAQSRSAPHHCAHNEHLSAHALVDDSFEIFSRTAATPGVPYGAGSQHDHAGCR